MPIAIIITDEAIPAIIEEQTSADLLARVNALQITLDGQSIEQVKAWLDTLPRPSGWYDNRADAQHAASLAVQKKQQVELTGADVRKARDRLGMTREQFGRALGFNGNSNTLHKAIWQIERDKSKLRPDKQEIMFGLLAALDLAAE